MQKLDLGFGILLPKPPPNKGFGIKLRSANLKPENLKLSETFPLQTLKHDETKTHSFAKALIRLMVPENCASASPRAAARWRPSARTSSFRRSGRCFGSVFLLRVGCWGLGNYSPQKGATVILEFPLWFPCVSLSFKRSGFFGAIRLPKPPGGSRK